MLEELTPVILTLEISAREGGGLCIRCQEYPEIYISGSSPDDVFADIGPVMQRILRDNHGFAPAEAEET